MMAEAAPFRAALVTMRASRSVDDNLRDGLALIREAARRGAHYVQTPEMTNIMEAQRDRLQAALEDEGQDRSLAIYRALAQDLGIVLHLGSLAIRVSPERAVNRSYVIGTDGAVLARYDKIHMFDVDLGSEESYRESATFQPGESAVAVDLPFGRLGLSICYDLRFPVLYRSLAEAGAHYLAVPAAFTHYTGAAHWHVLLRARAIETGSFVLAAAQGGRHANGRETFGHSLVVDPWGEIVAEGGTEPGVIVAEIDPSRVEEARRRIPSLQHGRRFAIAAPEPMAEHLHPVRGGA